MLGYIFGFKGPAVLWPTCYFINMFLLVYLSLSDLKIAYGAAKGLVLCFVDKDVLYM